MGHSIYKEELIVTFYNTIYSVISLYESGTNKIFTSPYWYLNMYSGKKTRLWGTPMIPIWKCTFIVLHIWSCSLTAWLLLTSPNRLSLYQYWNLCSCNCQRCRLCHHVGTYFFSLTSSHHARDVFAVRNS